MKKISLIFMMLCMLLTMSACGLGIKESASTQSKENVTEAAAVQTSAQTTSSSKILVAYFSPTGSTKQAAEFTATALGADLYEIQPTEPYTADDLNYNNNNSRSTVEMHDASSRPAIANVVNNMEQYNTVFVAYPIWWGEAPRILSTFMESYDFAGKTIIPFCTSASSPLGNSAENLARLTTGANWLPGQRFGSSVSKDEIVSWLNGLGQGFEVK